jgi:hypothetical protein
MRNFILIGFLLLDSIIFSQFQLGAENRSSMAPVAFSPKYLEGIETTRTIFVHRDSDENLLHELKEALGSVWDINELVFMSYDDFLSYQVKNGECYFTISVDNTVVTGSGGSVSYLSNFGLSFWRQVGEYPKFFSYTQLFAELEANLAVMREGLEGSNILERLYTEIDIRNWNLTFLKATLKDISDALYATTSRSPYKLLAKSDLSRLKSKTLYVSDDLFYDLKRISRSETKNVQGSNLMDAYTYAYKVVNNGLIDELTLEQADEYCLTYVRNALGKFLVVIHLETGELLFSFYTRGYDVDKGDIRVLLKNMN